MHNEDKCWQCNDPFGTDKIMNDFNNLTTIFEFTMKYNIDTSNRQACCPGMECQLLITLIFLGEKRGQTKRLDQPRRDMEEWGHLQDGRDLFQSFQCSPCPQIEADWFWQCMYLLPLPGWHLYYVLENAFMVMGWVKVKWKNDSVFPSSIAWNDCAYKRNFSFECFFLKNVFRIHQGDIGASAPLSTAI